MGEGNRVNMEPRINPPHPDNEAWNVIDDPFPRITSVNLKAQAGSGSRRANRGANIGTSNVQSVHDHSVRPMAERALH